MVCNAVNLRLVTRNEAIRATKYICTYVHKCCSRSGHMARMNIVVSDKVEEKFREAVFMKYGMKKGNITKAAEQALQEWIEREKEKRYQHAQ